MHRYKKKIVNNQKCVDITKHNTPRHYSLLLTIKTLDIHQITLGKTGMEKNS